MVEVVTVAKRYNSNPLCLHRSVQPNPYPVHVRHATQYDINVTWEAGGMDCIMVYQGPHKPGWSYTENILWAWGESGTFGPLGPGFISRKRNHFVIGNLQPAIDKAWEIAERIYTLDMGEPTCIQCKHVVPECDCFHRKTRERLLVDFHKRAEAA